MREEYTSQIIENTRRQMNGIGYEKLKKEMLDGVALTGSWIKLEDLKEIMPENEYQELLKKVEMKARRRFTTEKYPEASEEKLEEAIQEEINSTTFEIAFDGNKGHNIEEFFERGKDKIVESINVKDIDGAKLAHTIAKVMQRHLDYGTFHSNQYFSAEELERVLKSHIDMLKRQEIVFKQDRGKVETEKEGKSSPKVETEDMKKRATPAEKTYLGDIKTAVAYLQECNRNGQNVYVDFNGHKLYSCDVTLESAYMEVVGMTKEEDEAIREEYIQAKTEEEKEAIIAKWNSIRKAHTDAGDKKGNTTVLESAIEATEETTKTSTINGQAQGIKDASKGKDEKVEETEIVE